MCCHCNIDKEHFNHIWICPKAKKDMKQIINAALKVLKNQLFIHTSQTVYPPDINSLLIPTHPFWALKEDPYNITFIDFIKGIIPTALPQLLNSFTKSSSRTSKILSPFYDYIFDQSYDVIWKSRCAVTIEKERSLNISKYSKKRNYSSSNNFSINSYSNSFLSLPEHKYDHASLMTKSFIHGRKWSFFLTQ